MLALYNTIFYEPILNLLIWLYNTIPGDSIGLAIVAVTVIIQVLLYPLSAKMLTSQRALQSIQPKVEALKKKYGKENKEAMAKEMMALYKAEKVNPASSCLPLLVQFPILIGVYQVFAFGLSSPDFSGVLYSFVPDPGLIHTQFLWVIDLASRSVPLALLAAASQYIQTRMLQARRPEVKGKGARDEDFTAIMNKQMLYAMPIMTFGFGFILPGGLMLYWFLRTVLTIAQQWHMFRGIKEVQPVVVEAEITPKQS
jgi:YidC/Oxa1 family membrane protein insertase